MSELSYASGRDGARAITHPRLRADVVPFGLGGLGVLGLGAANGGYFASSWGWPVVALAAVLVWALGAGGIARPTVAERTFVGLLVALTVWSASSTAWGVASAAIDDTFRVLVYVVGAATALTLVRRQGAGALLAGVLAGAVGISLYALATRLFPDRLGTFDSVAGYRLATPIGYWNGLGLLCAIGLLLAIALAATTPSPVRAALAAAPAPVLASTLYFTFSRGSWISLAAGLAAALALDPRRLRLTAAALALGLPSAAAVLFASHSRALTHLNAAVARAAHEGHRLALLVFVFAAAAAVLTAGWKLLQPRIAVPAAASRLYAAALATLALAAFAGALVHFGGPVGTARSTWDSFAARPPNVQGNLGKRLFSFSGSGRVDLWRAAWHDFEAHPVVGSGEGSYEAYWLQHRPYAAQVRNAHSLYLETLAELGIVGLLILVGALAAPLVAAVRARKRPGVAAATGAYVAYLVGAGVDWDWQLTAVTLAAVLVGAGLLAAARSDDDRVLSPRLRYGMMAAAVAAGSAGFVFLVGNMFLSRSSTAAAHGDWAVAVRDARRASDWLPWSTAPLTQLGEAQLGAGRTAAARATFRSAIRKDRGDWSLWLDLARASTGKAEVAALARATQLDPLAPEIAEFKSELGTEGGISIAAGGA